MMVWVDIETMGLDPAVHGIIEVGIVVTDDDGVPLPPHPSACSWLIRPDHDGTAESWPLRQHTLSGLLEKARRKGDHPGDVEMSIVAWLAQRTPTDDRRPPVMCGSSVHFDRAFLRAQMPRVEAWFRYRNFDVSTLATFCEAQGATDIWPTGDAPRNALGDLERTIEAYQRCVAWARRDS